LGKTKIAITGHDHIIVYKTNEKRAPMIGEHELIPIKSIANKIILIEKTEYGLVGLSCGNIQLINFKDNTVN
jgi:hypothetical protein